MVDSLIGTSKFAFMKDGQITTYGKYIEDEGLLFSNDSYKPYQFVLPVTSTSYRGRKYYDDYIDDDCYYNRYGIDEYDDVPTVTMKSPTNEQRTQFYADWIEIIDTLYTEGAIKSSNIPDYKLYAMWRDDVCSECSSYDSFMKAWYDYFKAIKN